MILLLQLHLSSLLSFNLKLVFVLQDFKCIKKNINFKSIKHKSVNLLSLKQLINFLISKIKKKKSSFTPYPKCFVFLFKNTYFHPKLKVTLKNFNKITLSFILTQIKTLFNLSLLNHLYFK